LSTSLKLAGLTFGLRLDRVDALEGGGVAIIDYKTGRATATSKWFVERPQAPQLALYTFAFHAASPSDPVRAVAYAQLHPAELRLHGIAADMSAWAPLPEPSRVGHGLSDWASVEARWAEALTALAEEVAQGHAIVAPRNPKVTCRRCGLQALCRIGGPVEQASGDDDE